MNINLHIERLILDGIDIPHHQRPLLQAALEAELSRLLMAGGLAPSLRAGGALPRLSGAAIQVGDNQDPGGLGQQIAQAVYGGLGR